MKMNANHYDRMTLLVVVLLLQSITRLGAVELKHRELDTTNGSNQAISNIPLGST